MLCVHYFFSDDRKQDADTTDTHIKHIIELLNQRNIMYEKMSTLWDNIDGCSEQYRCATSIFILSILSQAFYVIIDHGVHIDT